MRRLRRMMASTVRVTLVASACLAVAMPTAANAKPEDCLDGKNGFEEISDNPGDYNSTPHGSVSFDTYGDGSAKVTLRVGRLTKFGDQFGWAQLEGKHVSQFRVWMDWTQDGGKTWIQCGPFEGNRYNRASTTSAKRTSKDKNSKFRACGDARLDSGGFGKHKCTRWW